jgi:hypothetical protein
MQNAYKMLVSKPDGKRPLGDPSHRREDNIKAYFKGIQCDGVDSIHLTLGMVQ